MKYDTGSTGLMRNGTSASAKDQVASLVSGTDAETSGGSSNEHCTSLTLSLQAKLQQDFLHTDLGLSPTSNRCDELFIGPVNGSQPPCPVSVEFEGTVLFLCLFELFICCIYLYICLGLAW